MLTVTLPKSKFETIKKKADLYEAILKTLPERKWGIEKYSPRRVKEFLEEDRLDKKTLRRVKRPLD